MQHMSSIAEKYLENYLMINLTLHTPLIEHSVGQVLRILFPEPSLDIVLDNSILSYQEGNDLDSAYRV